MFREEVLDERAKANRQRNLIQFGRHFCLDVCGKPAGLTVIDINIIN